MKQLIAIVLIFVLSFPFGMKLSIWTNYAVQYSYYAKELCKNLDKPELKCNGKCQLIEELKSSDQNDDLSNKTPQPSSESNVEVSPFLVDHLNLNNSLSSELQDRPVFFWKFCYSFQPDDLVFQPPC